VYVLVVPVGVWVCECVHEYICERVAPDPTVSTLLDDDYVKGLRDTAFVSDVALL
jgi:hypothetical protein